MESNIQFYSTSSNFDLSSSIGKIASNNHYPIKAAYSPNLSPTTAIMANSDMSVCLVDLNNGVVQKFQDTHKDRIEGLVFNSLINRDDGGNVFPSKNCVLTASEDKSIKIWDVLSGLPVMSIKHRGQPFYSVDTNTNVIVAGTNEDIVFWDVRNTKGPMGVLDESHCDDITAVKFHPNDP
jgi:WD40 repeat protein